jgi:hypothetical protein
MHLGQKTRNLIFMAQYTWKRKDKRLPVYR